MTPAASGSECLGPLSVPPRPPSAFFRSLDDANGRITELEQLRADAATARAELTAAVGFYNCPCGSTFEFAEDSTLQDYGALNRWLGRHVPCGDLATARAEASR